MKPRSSKETACTRLALDNLTHTQFLLTPSVPTQNMVIPPRAVVQVATRPSHWQLVTALGAQVQENPEGGFWERPVGSQATPKCMKQTQPAPNSESGVGECTALGGCQKLLLINKPQAAATCERSKCNTKRRHRPLSEGLPHMDSCTEQKLCLATIIGRCLWPDHTYLVL